MPTRILIAEDEDTLRHVIARVLRREGYEVVEAASGEEALEKFREAPCPILMTDIVMGPMNGFDLIEEALEIAPDTVTIVMTSHSGLDAVTGAMRVRALDLLIKPFEDIRVITSTVHRAAERVQLIRENHELIAQLQSQGRQLERASRNLTAGAARDADTGLYNEQFFREALEIELARSERYARPFSVCLVDIPAAAQDGALLKEAARLLDTHSRNSDLVARWSDDRLALLLPETSREGALVCAESRRSNLAEHLGTDRPHRDIFVGVASFPENGDQIAKLLDRAEEALVRATQSGRGRVLAWDPSEPTPA